ncbi:MAG: hypothetical protein K6T83_09680 [Alicyclobacillus sp.]|nr:hypothetical protein [Alicyclobacillus sp.]
MERLMTLHWDWFVAELQRMPDPSPQRTQSIKAGEELLDRILSADLPAEYLLNVHDDALSAAWEIATADDADSDPLLDMAQMRVDESVWDQTLGACFHLSSICDPSVAEVFL